VIVFHKSTPVGWFGEDIGTVDPETKSYDLTCNN
jgi:hypothetical protein